MKYVKTFGLAAMAAMALMAFIASSASATALYSNTTKQGAGTEINATLTGGTATLETLEGTVLDTCKGGGVAGKTNNAGGAGVSVTGTIESLTWSECTKTTDTLNPGSLEIHWISGTKNGTLTAIDAEVTINTIFGSCVYGSAKALNLGTVVGSTTGNATMEINTKVPKISGNFACPAESRWTASYTVTTPSPLHVTKE